MRRRILLAAVFFTSLSVAAPHGSAADFPIAPGKSLQVAPAIAHDPGSNRYLTVWSDLDKKGNTELDVYGRLLDSKGKPASDAIPIAKAPKGQGFASAAFDPGAGRYLVVWTDWRNAVAVDSDIYGRLVNRDGTFLGEAFAISAKRGASQKYPAVAFDPHHRRFLIVWSDNRNKRVEKVHGRFVDPGGNLLGEAFRVTGEGGGQDRTSLTFDDRRRRFLVVWREAGPKRGRAVGGILPSKAIYGAFIDPEKGPTGSRFLIALEKEGGLPPSLYAAGYSPKDDLYFVAWTSGRDYAKQGLDIYGAFLRPGDGSLDRPMFPIAATTDYQEAASVAFDPNRNRFLVVWYDLRRDPAAKNMDIYGRYVFADRPMSSEFLISDFEKTGMRRYPALSFSPKSDDFLVLWEDGRDRGMAGRQIYGSLR